MTTQEDRDLAELLLQSLRSGQGLDLSNGQARITSNGQTFDLGRPGSVERGSRIVRDRRAREQPATQPRRGKIIALFAKVSEGNTELWIAGDREAEQVAVLPYEASASGPGLVLQITLTGSGRNDWLIYAGRPNTNFGGGGGRVGSVDIITTAGRQEVWNAGPAGEQALFDAARFSDWGYWQVREVDPDPSPPQETTTYLYDGSDLIDSQLQSDPFVSLTSPFLLPGISVAGALYSTILIEQGLQYAYGIGFTQKRFQRADGSFVEDPVTTGIGTNNALFIGTRIYTANFDGSSNSSATVYDIDPANGTPTVSEVRNLTTTGVDANLGLGLVNAKYYPADTL